MNLSQNCLLKFLQSSLSHLSRISCVYYSRFVPLEFPQWLLWVFCQNFSQVFFQHSFPILLFQTSFTWNNRIFHGILYKNPERIPEKSGKKHREFWTNIWKGRNSRCKFMFLPVPPRQFFMKSFPVSDTANSFLFDNQTSFHGRTADAEAFNGCSALHEEMRVKSLEKSLHKNNSFFRYVCWSSLGCCSQICTNRYPGNCVLFLLELFLHGFCILRILSTITPNFLPRNTCAPPPARIVEQLTAYLSLDLAL